MQDLCSMISYESLLTVGTAIGIAQQVHKRL
jgi:hypothetical protein